MAVEEKCKVVLKVVQKLMKIQRKTWKEESNIGGENLGVIIKKTWDLIKRINENTL